MDAPQQTLRFDGPLLEDSGHFRLTGQWLAVFNLMRDGKFRILREIAESTGYPEASVSARLRDFRKPRFGGHTVERKNMGEGLFHYRLFLRQPE